MSDEPIPVQWRLLVHLIEKHEGELLSPEGRANLQLASELDLAGGTVGTNMTRLQGLGFITRRFQGSKTYEISVTTAGMAAAADWMEVPPDQLEARQPDVVELPPAPAGPTPPDPDPSLKERGTPLDVDDDGGDDPLPLLVVPEGVPVLPDAELAPAWEHPKPPKEKPKPPSVPDVVVATGWPDQLRSTPGEWARLIRFSKPNAAGRGATACRGDERLAGIEFATKRIDGGSVLYARAVPS